MHLVLVSIRWLREGEHVFEDRGCEGEDESVNAKVMFGARLWTGMEDDVPVARSEEGRRHK